MLSKKKDKCQVNYSQLDESQRSDSTEDVKSYSS